MNELALALMIEQIADGKHLTCEYCDRHARWLIRTGADPERTPHCDEHGKMIASVTLDTMSALGAA